MQRHRKYLVVTIWVSTIAFIGAGFVGWGQYSYGDKAGAVAKVGDISITTSEFQKSYAGLFNQYNQLFGGKLDEKQAKQFGLERQALRQLVNQALVLNLAETYGLSVTDEELWNIIKTQNVFQKDGQFDKATYEAVLKENSLSMQEYEATMKKELLIQKTLFLLGSQSLPYEIDSLAKAAGVSDKIAYKILTPSMVNAVPDDNALKAFWEKHKNDFKTEASYDVAFVRQAPVVKTPSDKEIEAYYNANRSSLKDANGAPLALADARSSIIAALNGEATEKEALRLYIDYKKGNLDKTIVPEQATASLTNPLFSAELTKEIASLSTGKPFLKPRKIGESFIVIKLEKTNPSRTKTFEEAKTEANILYLSEMKRTKLQELAQNSYKTFEGTVSDFLTRGESSKLAGLNDQENAEFLSKLFTSKQKQGFVTLQSGNVILYNVLEQKLLQNGKIAEGSAVSKLKADLLDSGLLKTLESKYPVEIYAEGI